MCSVRRWEGLHQAILTGGRGRSGAPSSLQAGPLPRPSDWETWVNRPQTGAEEEALRRSVNRGAPWGDTKWIERTAKHLGLEFTLRPRGHPTKEEKI